jgi:DNA-binding NarL/FixJ family response regulator
VKIAVIAPGGWTTDVLCGMAQKTAPSATVRLHFSCRDPAVRQLEPNLVLLQVESTAGAAKAIAAAKKVVPTARLVLLGPPISDRQMQMLFRAGAGDYLSSTLAETVLLGTLRWIVDSIGGAPPAQSAPDSESGPADVAGEIEDIAREFGLTRKQAEVLTHICERKSNAEIAKALDITEGTVKLHVTQILKSMKVTSRRQAEDQANKSRFVILEQLRRAQGGKADLRWFLDCMTHQRIEQGTIIFRKGDLAEELYYLQRGTVHLPEIGVQMKEGEIFGEIGVFSLERKRTCTAQCATGVDVFRLTADEARRLYFVNPSFGYYIIHRISSCLLADRARVT